MIKESVGSKAREASKEQDEGQPLHPALYVRGVWPKHYVDGSPLRGVEWGCGERKASAPTATARLVINARKRVGSAFTAASIVASTIGH